MDLITIDLSGLTSQDPISLMWWFVTHVAWIFIVIFFVYGLVIWWQKHIRNETRSKRTYILLAIDIPKNNEQTPRAIENFFQHLAGAHSSHGFLDKWWFGSLKDSFSFEIVSIGGFIQFIVHLPSAYRDYIEALVYAQYPEAEITEIEDYTERWDLTFPNDEYDLVGSEVTLAAPEAYPIITYREFEDTIAGEYKDPMAGMMEVLSRVKPGQEVWIQYVVTPADNDWAKSAQPVINKIIGAKVEKKKTIFDRLFDLVNYSLQAVFAPASESSGGDDGGKEINKLQYLTDGQKNTVKAIEQKINKTGFHVTIRFIYLGKKENFDKTFGIKAVYGSFKQFNTMGYNGLKPDKKTLIGGVVFRKQPRLNKRKNTLFKSFKDRGNGLNPGEYGPILNSEELATLWHFPMMNVKAPLVKKTESKRSEPPVGLPTEESGSPFLKASYTKPAAKDTEDSTIGVERTGDQEITLSLDSENQQPESLEEKAEAGNDAKPTATPPSNLPM